MPDVKVKEASPFSGERIRYSPNGNGGGNDDPSSCSDEWICPKIPKPSEVISDEYFWTTLQKGSDFYDDDEDICSPELSSQSNLRRRLLEVPGPTPTGKLDLPNQKKFDFTTGPIPGFKYRDRDGRQIGMSNKPLKKIAYCHSTDLDIYNLANRIACPLQSDPNKFQRTDLIGVLEM